MFDSFKFIGLEVGDFEPGANDKEVAFGFFLCFPLFPTRDTPISPRSRTRSFFEFGWFCPQAMLSLRVSLLPIDEKTGLQTQPEPMVFAERSRFVKNAKGEWLYGSGEVSSEAAGLKGRVLNDEKDLGGLQKDVDFVNSLFDQAKKNEGKEEAEE